MKRFVYLLIPLILTILTGCISRTADVDQTTATIEDALISDGDMPSADPLPLIEFNSHYHIPARGHLRDGDGLFLICADEVEMNQGSHYDAVQVNSDSLQSLPRYFFLQEYVFFGQPVTVAFEYTVFENRIVVTYVSEDSFSYRIYTDQQTDGNVLLLLEMTVDEHSFSYLSYPVLLDPRTGAVTDFLSGISLELLPSGIFNAMELMDEHRLLVRMNGGAYYYYDTPNGVVYQLSDILGYSPQYCAAVPGGIICYDGDEKFQYVDCSTLAVTDIVLNVTDVEMFYGLVTTGNQTFALYRDESGNLYWFDFLTMDGGAFPEPEGWHVETDLLYPSYDGRKVFMYRRNDLGGLEALIFDADRGQAFLLDWYDPDTSAGSGMYWARDNSLVIESDSGQDFYVYQWKEQDTDMLETEQSNIFQPQDADFVRVLDYIPDLVVEMKYAYPDNFTGHAIYEFEDAYLRYGTVRKLMAVQDALRPMGLGLKLWDGFRPVAAQFKLWEILPDDTYVANPNVGFSSHSRGNTVDITLVDSAGREVPMPTGFDDFSALADRDYSDCPGNLAENAILLENIMQENGFVGYFGEWWHFADSVRYDVEKCFNPGIISTWYADCEEYISLRSAPDTASSVLDRIPVRESCTLLGYTDNFALVDFRGQRGYVLSAYLKPEKN